MVDKKVSNTTNADILLVKGNSTTLSFNSSDSELVSKYLTKSEINNTKIAVLDNNKVSGIETGATTINTTLSDGTIIVTPVKVYDVTVKENDNEVNTDINSIAKEVIESIVSENETNIVLADKTNAENIKKAATEGKSIAVEISSQEVKTSEVSDTDKTNIEKELNEDGETYQVAGYYNIDILVKADNEKIAQISELGKTIEVKVNIPEGLPEVAEGYTRLYKIVRIHGTEVETLNTVDNNDGTLSCNSDKFSIYAVGYVDVSEQANARGIGENSNDTTTDDESINGNGNKENTNTEVIDSNSTSEGNSGNPKTGDNIITFTIIFVVAVAGIFIAVKKINK